MLRRTAITFIGAILAAAAAPRRTNFGIISTESSSRSRSGSP